MLEKYQASPSLVPTHPRVGKRENKIISEETCYQHNLDQHSNVKHVNWDQIIQSKGFQMILTKR